MIDDNEPLSQPGYNRASKDIKSVIKLAKLNERNLTDLTQVVYYGSSDSADNFKLLELNDDLMSAIEKGESLYFKGGLQEKVVLCTDSRTFEVKEAGISNSLLLVPDLKLGQATSNSPIKSPKNRANTSTERAQNESTDSIEDDEDDDAMMERPFEQRFVEKVFHEYFECREVNPKFRKLGDLLQLTRYSGPENEHFIDRSLLFTYQQLLDTAQCSRQEFDAGLKMYRAFSNAGRIRAEIGYFQGIVTENSWTIDTIHRDQTFDAISEAIAPTAIVQTVFDLYATPSEQSTSTSTLYKYDEEMVCRTIAQNVLQQGSKFHLADFMETWQNALPDGFCIHEKYLRGLAVIDRAVENVPCVRALIEQDLPANVIDRLKMLFKIRERWSPEDIEPYIKFFATPQLSISSILAKHARAITEGGRRIYVSKHGN